MDVNIYDAGIGLNNRVTAHRLPFSTDDGVSALSAAKDVMIDSTGEVLARRGMLELFSGDFHSTFPAPDNVSFYVVENVGSTATLYRAVIGAIGLALRTIVTGLAPKPLSYFKYDDAVYYSNGFERGVLRFDEMAEWPVNIWTGGKTNTTFETLPVGKHIANFHGRALSSVGKEVFFSEYGLLGLIDGVKARRRLGSEIKMLQVVDGGVYVSDKHSVYFFSGADPNKWGSRKVLDYPAVEYSVLPDQVGLKMLGFDTTALGRVFGTTKGIVVGLSDGSVYNLINKNVNMPESCAIDIGSLMVVDETIVIQSGEV